MRLKGYVRVGDPVPVAVQNLVLREYCKRHGHEYFLSDVEFVWGGTSMLDGLTANLAGFDAIVAYSMFQVPATVSVPIHFALEGYELPRDQETVETLWKIRGCL